MNGTNIGEDGEPGRGKRDEMNKMGDGLTGLGRGVAGMGRLASFEPAEEGGDL